MRVFILFIIPQVKGEAGSAEDDIMSSLKNDSLFHRDAGLGMDPDEYSSPIADEAVESFQRETINNASQHYNQSAERKIPVLKFKGTLLGYFPGQEFGASDYWMAKIDEMQYAQYGIKTCSDRIKLTTFQAVPATWGVVSQGLKAGDKVLVYGAYISSVSDCEVTMAGSEEYYVRQAS